MSLPLVSVIIATYRRTDSLKNAIKSVLAQDYSNYELIIVDDNADAGWNAKVTEIVDAAAGNSANVRLIHNHPNQGSAKTRNIGISAAQGEYICFLDDDDVYLPERLSHQVKDMQDTGADYGITDLILYNEDGTVSSVRRRSYLQGKEKDNLLLCHLKYFMSGTDTLMFRREFLTQIGGFGSIDYGDEYYLIMSAIEARGKLVYSPVCDVRAYVHTGQGGLSSGQAQIDGENVNYAFRKQYFPQIRSKDRRYITMRHYAVLAFAYKRSAQPVKFLISGVRSMLTSPLQCLQMLMTLRI